MKKYIVVQVGVFSSTTHGPSCQIFKLRSEGYYSVLSGTDPEFAEEALLKNNWPLSPEDCQKALETLENAQDRALDKSFSEEEMSKPENKPWRT